MTQIITHHEMLPEGESTAKWAMRKPEFMGSIQQLLCCARCGSSPPKRRDEPRKYRDVLKSTMHFICDECHDQLPE